MCVSRILRKRIDEELELDENCIIQPGRAIPKEQYVRRRAYTKQHKSIWEAAIKKYKHVKCIFQNCHFLALSVEDMISHFGYCNGDGSFAKFACPYCDGRVTSEKILKIHIRRSHGIINNHFLDMRDNTEALVNSEIANTENEFRTLGGNVVVDVKIEEAGCDNGEDIVSRGLFIAENDVSATENKNDFECGNTRENELGCSQEAEVDESIMSDEQRSEFTKQTNNEEKCYRGDHIYFKKMGKLTNEVGSNSLLVMKNTNLKHYSGPRNVAEKTINYEIEEEPTEDSNFSEEDVRGTERGMDSSEKQNTCDSDYDKQGKFLRQMIKFSFPSVQNTRRKVHQSYTNSWNQSIKTNGFARCLVATCNFISLDIFHMQNHFKTCSGVPANGPNLCAVCNSWLPSAIELSIHLERCKMYLPLMDFSHVSENAIDKESDVTDLKCEEIKSEEEKDSLVLENFVNESAAMSEGDPFQIGNDNKNDGTIGTAPKKEKASSTLRISDILKLKENGIMDINRIIQPGPVLPKNQYLRRRAYTKQHRSIWEAALEKHKYVKCIFQNCHFVAMSVEDMIYHFGYCIGDGSFASFECPHCGGRLTSKMVLDIHIRMSHPEMVTNECEDDSGEMDGDYGSNVDDVLPSVEELKKLVSSREIKTYGRNSTRSRTTKPEKAANTFAREPYEWWETDGEPFLCVSVVLEENKSDSGNSAPVSENIAVETDLVSDISDEARGSVKKIDCVSCDEINGEREACSHNNNNTPPSELQLDGHVAEPNREISLGKDDCKATNIFMERESSILEDVVEYQCGKSLVIEGVDCTEDVNRLKNCEDSPEEDEDPSARGGETDQERPSKEERKTSEGKGPSGGQRRSGESRSSHKPEDGSSDSSPGERSSRRGRHGKSPDHSRHEGFESKEDETDETDCQRPSKRKAKLMEEDGKSEVEDNSKIARVELIENKGGTIPPRKRGRPPKKKTAASKKRAIIDEPIPEPIADIVKKGRRGRKRKKEEETDQAEERADNSEVKCGKCDFRTKRQRFNDHNFRVHVGLSWIEGETPLDPTNEEEISHRIKQAFKVIKSAHCEICDCVKKSALGFISHVQNCGKSEEEKEALKITCPHCPARMLKYSLPMHLKLSHPDSPEEGGKTEEDIKVLTKRRSAIRAANKFQEVLKLSDDEDESKSKAVYVLYEKGVSKFPKLPVKTHVLWKKMIKEKKKIRCRHGNCLVESGSVPDAKRHHFTCPELPEKSYMCQQCNFCSATEDEIREHVDVHPNIDGDFIVGSEEEKAEKEIELNEVGEAGDHVRSRSRIAENPVDALEAAYKMKFFARENLLNARQTRFCSQSLRMMLNNELEEVEDGTLPLSQLRTSISDWIAVSLSSVHSYLPSLEESMSFCVTRNRKAVDCAWKKLGRFEGEISDGAPIIFTGGSVLSLSWCKNSSVRSFRENPRQYLAVSSSKDMRKFQEIHEVPDNLSGCVQIWDCGELKSTPEIPKMVIGIIHDSGQVWDLSWFPIDTYEEGLEGGATRIGLLGAACQDGTIRIWSICDSQMLRSNFRLPLYRAEPKVILELEGSETVGCLRLAIGKSGIIAGGFANGITAIWNLKAVSSPFCKKIGKSFILKPHLSFQAHRTSITALSICPNSDRYIATSGMDRFLRLWDLECVINPVESTLREVCLDNAWSRHWPVTISTFDDVIPYNGKGMIKAIRDAYCEKHRAPLTMDNTCWSLSVNDWINAVCGCNSRGEVKIRYMRNMFMDDKKFRLRTGHLFSSTDLRFLNDIESEGSSDKEGKTTKKKSKNASTIPKTYEESHRYFGLIFNDYAIRDEGKQKSEGTSTKVSAQSQCMEEYPIASINKVCWNPNFGSFKFLAMGYQSGFVRIRQLEDVRCKEEFVRFFREAKNVFTKI